MTAHHTTGPALDEAPSAAIRVAREERDEATAANQAKADFLAWLSHELRTPVTSIVGFGQLLQESGLDDDQLDWVRRMVDAGGRIMTLAEDILEFSQAEAGKLRLRPTSVNVGALAADEAGMLAPQANDAQVDLSVRVRTSRRAFADPDRLRQVIANLLTNGVKYNRPNGSVVLDVLDGRDGGVRIEVRDTGVGIAQDDLERVFEPFERVGTVRAQGAGVGLSLARNLVEGMGGTIGAHSTPQQGSTFWVELLPATGDHV